MPRPIEIVEVGPRDGLQNEKTLVSTEDKVTFIRRAIAAGAKRIEIASFVHPKLVPQMADAEDVVNALGPVDGVTRIGLTLNKRGALRALDCGIDQLGAVCVASDGFGMKNQNQNSAETVATANEIIHLAQAEGRSAQATISTAFGCPFDGEVAEQRVLDIVAKLAEAGPSEIALADTIGVGVPSQVTSLVSKAVDMIAPIPVRVHFHNTRNTGLANAYAAIAAGVQALDASIGGIGGCPFAPNATGNVPAEDIVFMLERGDIQSGLSLPRVVSAAQWLTEKMGRTLPGMVSRSGGFPEV